MGYAGSEYHKGPGWPLELSSFAPPDTYTPPPPVEPPPVPDPEPEPDPEEPPPEPDMTPPSISKLVLVNADTQTDLRDLGATDLVTLSEDGFALNIRANVSSSVKSVKFKLDGVAFRTENAAPFAFAGDASGVYNAWTPTVGEHVVIATPYTGANGGGQAGTPVAVALTVQAAPPVTDDRPTNYVSPTFRWPGGFSGGWPFRVDPYTLGTPNNDTNDYWSDSGQVAYDPDGTIPFDPGLGATASFAYTHGVFATQPRWDPPQYRGGTPNPDPSVRLNSNIAANGGALSGCLTQVRTTNTTGNCCLVLWSNGLLTIASTQTGHGNIPWPVLKLPANKHVYDLAVTSNNELALIALFDSDANKGQIAVVMLEGRGDIDPTKGTALETFAQMGLFNQGSFSAFSLIGYFDLPVNGPLKIAAAANGRWTGPSETNGTPLGRLNMTSPTVLSNLYNGPWQKTIAKGGYAVVLSKTENKAVVVDLSPILLYIRESWLSSLDSFNTTTAARAAGTWPTTFTATPSIKPTVDSQFTLTAPVSVLCGHYIERFSHDRFKFHVGLADGNVVIFDASKLMARFDYQTHSASIAEMGRFMVGVSPVGMCFSRHEEGQGNPIFGSNTTYRGDGQNSVIWVACNSDKKVVEILTFGGNGTVLRTLRDKRMNDPVDVVVNQRGYIVLVCDYSGKQLVGWRIGNTTNSRVTPPITYPPGQDGGYEISGFLPIPGRPKKITSSNVN